MIKEWKEKGGEERGEGAKVCRAEYKHSRDYKVTVFCSLLTVSCDKRLTTELCIQLCVWEKKIVSRKLTDIDTCFFFFFYTPSLTNRTHALTPAGRLPQSSVANRSLAGLQHLISLIRINDKTPKQSITSDCNAISYQRVGGCLKRLDEWLSIRTL